MKTLNDKVILTFGATSAIAQSVLRLWAARGARLGLFARDKDKAEAVAGDLRVRGAKEVKVFVGDLAETEKHADMVRQATTHFGKVDWALVAYGTLPDQKAAEKDHSLAEQTIHVNLTSPVSLCGELANYMEGQGKGTIGVLSSPAGDRGRQSNYIYGAAKGGLSVFLQGLRNRLQPKGVNVVTLIPGMVDTPMTVDFKKGLLFTTPDKIAGGISKSMERGRNRAYLPGFWFWIMAIIKSIPESIFKRLKL